MVQHLIKKKPLVIFFIVLALSEGAWAYNPADPNLGGFLPGSSTFSGGVSEQNASNIALLDMIRSLLPSGGTAPAAVSNSVLATDKKTRLTDQTVRAQSTDDTADDTAQ